MKQPGMFDFRIPGCSIFGHQSMGPQLHPAVRPQEQDLHLQSGGAFRLERMGMVGSRRDIEDLRVVLDMGGSGVVKPI